MTNKAKYALLIAMVLWASAFVGIRAALVDYSPEGLALLRYLVASFCMAVIYFRLPEKAKMPLRDIIGLLFVGAIGIGVYNLTLNYGERSVSSGMSSFIISQSPVITTFFAMIFLKERLNLLRLLGLTISVLGVSLISHGELGAIKWDASLCCILLATLAGGVFSVFQKPFLNKYSVIETTCFVIWGGTLFLLFFIPQLTTDLSHASFKATSTVVYLGIFPAAVGYAAWSFVLSEMPAGKAVSFLYFMPFVATLLGWVYLGEVPMLISLVGGICAMLGIWLITKSYQPSVIGD